MWFSLHDEGDAVHVLARGRGRASPSVVAMALQSPARASSMMFGRIEVGGVLGEAGRGRVLDALVDREDGEVARSAQAPVVVHGAEVAQHGGARSELVKTRSR